MYEAIQEMKSTAESKDIEQETAVFVHRLKSDFGIPKCANLNAGRFQRLKQPLHSVHSQQEK